MQYKPTKIDTTDKFQFRKSVELFVNSLILV